jgi:hypothetical protein
VVCAFVFHNYVNLGVGLKLTLGQEVRILSGWPASHLAANLTSPSLSNFGKVDLRVGILPGSVWDLWRTGVLESTVWKQVQIPLCLNARDADRSRRASLDISPCNIVLHEFKSAQQPQKDTHKFQRLSESRILESRFKVF